uniref:Ig-like domain-containing protein n=1 Tax=Rhabditophanes sp. KR3021 TaxID=114890 RepID=A0AC35TUC9_9BILA
MSRLKKYYFLSTIISITILNTINCYDTKSDDDACYRECEGTTFGCKTKLIYWNGEDVEGVYKLNNGIINITCTFDSLPRSVNVRWKFKRSPYVLSDSSVNNYIGNDNVYEKLKCHQLEYTHSCNVSPDHVQRAFSTCVLNVANIDMTGFYKCEAIDTNSGIVLAQSNEIAVKVIGIQSVRIYESKLIPQKSGYVQLEICANSLPRISWLTNSVVLQPEESKHLFSSSPITKIPNINEDTKIIPRMQPLNALEKSDPFCYYAQLFISNVDKQIENLKVSLAIEAEVEIRHLNIKIEDVKENSGMINNCYNKFNVLTVIAFLFLMI